jgi:hypothetical protein
VSPARPATTAVPDAVRARPGTRAGLSRRAILPLRLARTARRLAGLVAGAAILAAPVAAWAGLYKCALDSGGVTYQQDPCPPGKELRDFARDPANVSVVPFTFMPGTGMHSAAAAVDATAPRKKTERKTRKQAGDNGNAAERKFLFPGISEGEVIARVGRPDVSTGGGGKTTRWTYMPAPEDPATITMLTFRFGRLIEVERKVVPPR